MTAFSVFRGVWCFLGAKKRWKNERKSKILAPLGAFGRPSGSLLGRLGGLKGSLGALGVSWGSPVSQPFPPSPRLAGGERAEEGGGTTAVGNTSVHLCILVFTWHPSHQPELISVVSSCKRWLGNVRFLCGHGSASAQYVGIQDRQNLSTRGGSGSTSMHPRSHPLDPSPAASPALSPFLSVFPLQLSTKIRPWGHCQVLQGTRRTAH